MSLAENLLSNLKKPTRQMVIHGPLGIWTFPILNAIILIIYALRTASAPQETSERKARLYEFVRDEKGRIIQIVEYTP